MYCSIASLLVDMGVLWTSAERERRLFPLCTQVQATLWRQSPAYTTPQVWLVPVARRAEVTRLLRALLADDREGPCATS